MNSKSTKKRLKGILALVLCLTTVFCGLPLSAQAAERAYTSLYDEDKVRSEYFNQSEITEENSPNGTIMFPIVKADLNMENFYAIEVYRLGGTQGEATVTVESVDYTAQYGVDYEIYLGTEYTDSPVDGEAAPLYAMEEFSFIPVVTTSETEYESDETSEENSDILSNYASQFQDLITPSSSFELKFADGESSKKIYIKTMKDDTVTSDLEFIINLKDSSGATIGSQNSLGFTIIEEREEPETELKILDTQVNPESEEAYVIVARGGNIGTYGSYRVVTQSDTAKAGEDYEAVQMQLDFLPGMSEQKIPVKILSGASSGEKFTVSLENVKNATPLNSSATVTFSDSVEAEDAHKTAMIASSSVSDTTERGVKYVPISDFQESTHTNRGTGSQSWSFSTGTGYGKLYYSNGIASKNNAISIRTKSKINFTGVDHLSMVIDNLTGSCSWDHNAIYISDSDKFSSNTSDYDFMDDFDDDGIGASWDMTNVSDGHLVRATGTLTQSTVKGEHYLYIMLHKGGFAGEASFKILSDGNGSDNVLLHFTKYTIEIGDPDPVKMCVDGTMQNVFPAENLLISNPAASSSDPNYYVRSTDIYRDETVTINGSITNDLNGHVKLKGIVFCDKLDNPTKTSEIVPLSSDAFTLTAEMIEKYSGYFNGTKIYIKPVYTIDPATVDVIEYDSENGQKFVINDNTITETVNGEEVHYYNGTLYNDGAKIGTLKWLKPDRDNSSYLTGDTIRFIFTPENTDEKIYKLEYETRSASTAQLAQNSGVTTYTPSSNTQDIIVSDSYLSIKPKLYITDPGVYLNVTNPNCGNFSGKSDGLTTTGSDGSVAVSGYKKSDGTTVDFNKLAVGTVLSFFATPNSGYRAKWTCVDTVSGAEKVYYGDSFFYAIQNVTDPDDNNITLTFEAIDSSKQKSYYINGTTSIQEGSILSPPSSATETYIPISMASVTIGQYTALSDTNGEFYLETNPTKADSQKAAITLCGDETIRALVMYNNQYYITDVKIGDYISGTTTDTLTVGLKLDYKTYGPRPAKIQAYDNKNNSYGDSIPLVTANAVQFDLSLDLTQQDVTRPVNLVKWTIESDDGVLYTYEDELAENVSNSHFATILSEIAKPGCKLYVELFNKSTNSSGDNVYTTFGKFNTGYNFVATSVNESVTYAPDIGVPSTMALPAPCIGPINPTVSLYGLQPIFNVTPACTDDQGREIKTVTIGISYGALSNLAAEDKSFNTLSPLDKAKKLGDMLENYDKCYNETGSLPKFANKNGMASALNMKTAVKVNVSVALCFQANYYVDEESGEWMFVSQLLIIGFGGSLSISIPFTFFYIPCFTYITFALNTNIYMGIFPNTDSETGETVALTLTQLDSADASHFQGVYEIKGTLTFGLGIGFDGLVAASGNLSVTADIQFNDFMRGVGNLSMSGGVTLELLFLKYSWSEKLFSLEMFNTLADDPDTLQSVRSAFQEDLLNTVTLGDMSIETTTDESTVNDLPRLAADLVHNEVVVAESDTLVNPSIISLDEDKYLITTILNSEDEDSDGTHHKLYYIIYDEAQKTITDSGFVLDKYVSQMKQRSLTEDQINNLDSDVNMIDCGDDILITWTKLGKKITSDTDNLELLKSVGIASIYYNKESGKFYNYSLITSDNNNEIYMNSKAVYNSHTGLTQLFYEKMDASEITLDSTIAEIQQTPTQLATRYIDGTTDNQNWSDESIIALSENALNYYDVASVDDKNVLAFVGSDSKGFTLEDMSGFEAEEGFDTSSFNTVNSMYIQQFSLSDSKLDAGQQVKITGDNFVSANPEFAHINSNGIDNLLLFYKCNGLYAYQNINTLIYQGLYTDENGQVKIAEDYLEPQFITSDEDHTVNDDFMIVSNEDHIYALWTTSEGEQQQIWARSFCIDGVEEIAGEIVRDENGNATYDENGNLILDEFDKPIYLLKGCWGGKTYLTEGGLNGSESGKFKKDFDAAVMDNGDLLTIFNAYDIDYDNNGVIIENNKVAIAAYNTDSKYETTDAVDELSFSNDYPTAGETIQVQSYIKNTGVLNGENVTATLFVNGQAYAQNTYDHWLTAETKDVIFDFEMPQNIEAKDVEMYIEISEGDEVKFTTESYSLETGDFLSIQNISLLPIKTIGNNSDEAAFRVIATVKNIGNVDYTTGNYVHLMETDMQNMTAAVDEDSNSQDAIVHTIYGSTEISNIKVGDVKTISFNSDNIPKEVFEKSAGASTAYLEGIISDDSQIDKTTYKANEEINIISQFYPGLTVKPVAETIESLKLSDLTLGAGTSGKLVKEVTPTAAILNSEITYTSSDQSVATVDNQGVITALKPGTCEITATSEGITSTATITVTDAPAEEPTDNPSDEPTQPTDTDNPEQPTDTPTNGGGEPGNSTSSDNNSNGNSLPGKVATGGDFSSYMLVLILASAYALIVIRFIKNRKREISDSKIK